MGGNEQIQWLQEELHANAVESSPHSYENHWTAHDSRSLRKPSIWVLANVFCTPVACCIFHSARVLVVSEPMKLVSNIVKQVNVSGWQRKWEMQYTVTVHATQGDFEWSAAMSHAILPIFKYSETHCTNTLQSFKVSAECSFYTPTERELLICRGHIVPG